MAGDSSVVVKVVPNSRSISLRVLPNGTAVVTVSRMTPKFVINQFLAKHDGWLRARQQEAKERLSALVSEREKLFFRGVEYDFRLMVSALGKPSVRIRGQAIVVTSQTEHHDEVRKILQDFYRLNAIKYFNLRVPLLADLVDSDVKTVAVRSQRTRWGSCSSRNTISLNWRLIMVPDWVSDYVIYHELAHLTHMNHSQQFWRLVERYVPNHKDAQKWLKDHHTLLQF